MRIDYARSFAALRLVLGQADEQIAELNADHSDCVGKDDELRPGSNDRDRVRGHVRSGPDDLAQVDFLLDEFLNPGSHLRERVTDCARRFRVGLSHKARRQERTRIANLISAHRFDGTTNHSTPDTFYAGARTAEAIARGEIHNHDGDD